MLYNGRKNNILHWRTSGLVHLTKKESSSTKWGCHIVYDAIRAISWHAFDKVFDTYNSWYQMPCNLYTNCYPLALEYFLGREK